MNEYVKLEDYGIEFKNLLSGPAQVGRMLNYIIYAGNGILKHKPGNRNTTMENNIGSAWAIEFMIGLGLVKLGYKFPNVEVFLLELTSKGKKIFEFLQEKHCNPDFYDGNSVDLLKNQLTERGLTDLYHYIELAFRESAVFKNLRVYIDKKATDEEFYVVPRGDFNDELYAEMQAVYDPQESNAESKGNAGFNRVPSLVQMCNLLNYCIIEKGNIVFDRQKIKEGNKVTDAIVVSQEELVKLIKKEDNFNEKLEKLAEEYGIDGTTIVSQITRLSQVQSAFRDRLINEYGQKCMMCQMEQKEMLIASHIKPAKDSNIYEKANNNNGLLLCANHDKLFDKFLISFNFIDGKIMISDKLSNHDKRSCMLDPEFKLPSELMNPERCEFLMWHNNEFYKRNNK